MSVSDLSTEKGCAGELEATKPSVMPGRSLNCPICGNLCEDYHDVCASEAKSSSP